MLFVQRRLKTLIPFGIGIALLAKRIIINSALSEICNSISKVLIFFVIKTHPHSISSSILPICVNISSHFSLSFQHFVFHAPLGLLTRPPQLDLTEALITIHPV